MASLSVRGGQKQGSKFLGPFSRSEASKQILETIPPPPKQKPASEAKMERTTRPRPAFISKPMTNRLQNSSICFKMRGFLKDSSIPTRFLGASGRHVGGPSRNARLHFRLGGGQQQATQSAGSPLPKQASKFSKASPPTEG